MGEKRLCLICYGKYTDIVTNSKKFLSSIRHEKLVNQLPVIFLLKKLLRVSDRVCEKLLSNRGNPSTWGVSVCPSCTEFVDEAKRIHDQQLYLEKKLKVLRDHCETKIASSLEEYKKNRVFLNLRGVNFEVVDDIRAAIVEDLKTGDSKSSDELSAAAERLTSKSKHPEVSRWGKAIGIPLRDKDTKTKIDQEEEIDDPTFSVGFESVDDESDTSDVDWPNWKEEKTPKQCSKKKRKVCRNRQKSYQVLIKPVSELKSDKDNNYYVEDSEFEDVNHGPKSPDVSKQDSPMVMPVYDVSSDMEDDHNLPQFVLIPDGSLNTYSEKSEKDIIDEEQNLETAVVLDSTDPVSLEEDNPLSKRNIGSDCSECSPSFLANQSIMELGNEVTVHTITSSNEDERKMLSESEPTDEDAETKHIIKTLAVDKQISSPQRRSVSKKLKPKNSDSVTVKVTYLNIKKGDDESDSVQCGDCGKKFASAIWCEYHIGLAHSTNAVCPICDESFENNALMLVHRKSHVIAKKLNCDLCPFSFSSDNKLILHKRNEHGCPAPEDKLNCFNNLCDLCGRVLSNSRSLARHKKSVHRKEGDIKPYKCSLCPYRGIDEYAINCHVKYVHDRIARPSKTIKQCPKCDKQFLNNANLKKHLNSKHGYAISIKMMRHKKQCAHCDVKLSTNRDYLIHLNSKHGEDHFIKPRKRKASSTPRSPNSNEGASTSGTQICRDANANQLNVNKKKISPRSKRQSKKPKRMYESSSEESDYDYNN